jgi:hypothetical protein
MRRLIFFLPFLVACANASTQIAEQPHTELPPPRVVQLSSTPRPTHTPTLTSTFTPFPLPSDTASPTITLTQTTAPSSTASATLAPKPSSSSIANTQPSNTQTTQLPNNPTPSPVPVAHPYSRPIIVANYLAWYDPTSWSTGCTSDSPAAGAYTSSDSATISRHISQAQQAGLDGFTVHWGGPGDVTDGVLAQILNQGFGATATFLNHFFYGLQARATVAANLSGLMSKANAYGNWIRYAGKPVIFFADMQRVDTSGGLTPQQAWEQIRAATDPAHTTIWIAEGLDPSYLATFDGLYVYKIDHNCCPGAYASAGKWAGWVREAERLYGPRFWVATIQPGWDDSLTINETCNGVRVSSEPFARDREGGAYYQRTAGAALGTSPDMIVLNSFNEWVEGSFIEPSVGLGDLYLTLTAQYAAQFHGSR